jgi:capsular polysaccharide export protein
LALRRRCWELRVTIDTRHLTSAGSVYVARHIGLMMVPGLQRLLELPLVYRPVGRVPRDALALVGWGLKGKFRDAAALSERVGLPYLAVEDGFLRSVGLGDADPALSMVLDDVGIYYDAARPSALERLIATTPTAAQRARGLHIAAAWRQGRLSKYNHARETAPPIAGPFVLVVDQTFGDTSIELGMASPASFHRMLEAALDEHPGLPVVLKVHPDVIAGRKRAHFELLTAGAASRVTLMAGNAHPPGLLEGANAVYVVTSQMGFEALIWGRPVRCFGMAFYAGWGLTQDELAPPARRRNAPPVALDGLVHAALVAYPRYLDPETGMRCEPERVFEWMALQRRMRERFPAQVQALAFSNWKKPIAQAYLAGSRLNFVDTPQTLQAGEVRAVWGRPPDDAPAASCPQGELLHIEDGFLRSVGLGAHWVWPLSWVMDQRGMYYDATRPSDLEVILQTTDFDSALCERARKLRNAIVAAGITKYNVGTGGWKRPVTAARLVVLVPGQVESDASIAYGATGIRTNLELLQAVRRLRPDAYIVYKPHPDVVAKTRQPDGVEDRAGAWCDEVVVDTPIHRLFEQVDEVQVLTSLAGFEALLRQLPVVCHGSPFYSGWGLSTDVHPVVRRTRRLTLDELVAGALLCYPTYVSRVSGAFTTAERALWELSNWERAVPPVDPLRLRLLRRLKRWRDRLRRP